MRIVLLGAGAMGTIIGALLTERGYDIELVDTYKEHVEALQNEGAIITGNLEKKIPVKAILPGQVSGKYDLVLSLTKHNAIEQSLRAIKPFTNNESIVLSLQNGFPEGKIIKIFPAENVMGGAMEFSSSFIQPGVAELASERSTLGITFGSFAGPITDQVLEVKAILDCVGQITVTDNIKGVKWTKITDNSCFSGLPTALGCKVGDIIDDDFAMDCAANLGKECAKVIKASGVQPAELFGLYPSLEKLSFETNEEREKVKKYWIEVETPFRGQVASMLQDIRKGKKCEIDNINGEVVRAGEINGVPTPFNKKIVEIVTKLQDGELSLEHAWDNLHEFKKIM